MLFDLTVNELEKQFKLSKIPKYVGEDRTLYVVNSNTYIMLSKDKYFRCYNSDSGLYYTIFVGGPDNRLAKCKALAKSFITMFVECRDDCGNVGSDLKGSFDQFIMLNTIPLKE